ncbi:DUF1593 domain-containing protein [Salinisphaera sp.]|uniref:DUF1593 domain-containing protein n=1 Tax=Salinisphaera sp. TaxID=1914330 RepID=UPI002D79D29C|nr:DUF1593 domain-containing protein [Salinisphaera sp.]HET7313355.1 DUF1593 domain-containing protein [Salinisphaera sp.]
MKRYWKQPMVCREFLIRSLVVLAVVIAGVLTSSVSAKAMDKVGLDPGSKPRLMVLTDISSIKAGVREADDAQSMIRLMLYSNEFDIEGLIASSSLQHGHVVRPGNIRAIVDAYGKDWPNLVQNNENYPNPDQLRQVIKSGQPNADEDMPVYQSIGRGKSTPASKWIIRMVDKPDARPLWITIWGGSADLAQALWKVRNTRSRDEVENFVSKIRVIASGDQDSTGPWIKSHFPDLFYATRSEGGRGIYRGGNQRLVSSAWGQNNIKGHGALGAIYPDYRGGDIWSYKLGKVRGIKSGDSATFMGLIRNGLNIRGHLNWENWGGRLMQDANNPHRYHDAIDAVGDYKTDVSPYLAAVYRWRPAFQADYAARFDWCIKSYAEANHAPIGNNSVTYIQDITSGQTIKLRSGDWRDPDGNRLIFRWQVLEEESTYPGDIAIFTQYPQPGQRFPNWRNTARDVKQAKTEKQYSRTAHLNAPVVDRRRSVHVLLTVTDTGYPALSSYKRFNLIIHPK